MAVNKLVPFLIRYPAPVANCEGSSSVADVVGNGNDNDRIS